MNQHSLFDPALPENCIAEFVGREAQRMWPEAQHRKRSVAQVMKFAMSGDNQSRPLAHFLPRDIHEFAEKLVDSGSSKATANRYLASISKVFNHAVDEQVIVTAPKIKFYQVKSERVRYFSDLEIEQMLSFFNERGDWWMADMVTLALKTGMRKGEILALGRGDAPITDDGKWIFLPPEVTKTNKPRHAAITNPEANAAAVRLADGLMAEYTDKKFTTRWGLLKREYARKDDTYVFHVTRHNAASKMANELQVPTVIVAEALGHASLETTARYVHAKPDVLADIGSRM
tara:strand:+ start:1594 stop:2457 length:864 start_codon:yes stop_codon:yes gene_type:complete